MSTSAKVPDDLFGRGRGTIRIKEATWVGGERVRGLIRTRMMRRMPGADITGIAEADAKGAGGRVDGKEIVQDRANGGAVPLIKVSHPEANVTHEAGIGSVDKKELERFIAWGYAPDLTAELIVSGTLRERSVVPHTFCLYAPNASGCRVFPQRRMRWL